MTHEPLLKVGDALESVWGPEDQEGSQVGMTLDDRCSSYYHANRITVDRLEGPMGWYLVAVGDMEDGRKMVIPLHMAESIRWKP
ncbi:MAG: hypothetical protein GC201_18910 [Alphaproteobacteria bacterium]|nr:hypothetical protein [Alphaproteobacteria bacterium]